MSNSNNQNSNPWTFITGNPPGTSITQNNQGFFTYNPVETEETASPTPRVFKDGCVCVRCKELYPYAEPSEPDGVTLICWACKNGF